MLYVGGLLDKDFKIIDKEIEDNQSEDIIKFLFK